MTVRDSRNSRTATWLAGLLLLGVLATTGVALAFWSAFGTGTGVGATGSDVPVTLSPGTTTTGLYPGGAADVRLSIVNPNPTPVTVGRLALDVTQGAGGFSLDAAHEACGVTALEVQPQTNVGAGWTVPGRSDSGDGVLVVTLSGALGLGLEARDDCQGATITVHLKTST